MAALKLEVGDPAPSLAAQRWSHTAQAAAAQLLGKLQGSSIASVTVPGGWIGGALQQ